MNDDRAPRESELLPTCLHGRVLTQGRSFPVTITALSEDEVVAEGSDLCDVLGGFTLEMALESSPEGSWNPKCSGPQFLHFFTAGAERDLAAASSRVCARFTDMSEAARRLLRAYIAQLAGGRAARPAGHAFGRMPLGIAERA